MASAPTQDDDRLTEILDSAYLRKQLYTSPTPSDEQYLQIVKDWLDEIIDFTKTTKDERGRKLWCTYTCNIVHFDNIFKLHLLVVNSNTPLIYNKNFKKLQRIVRKFVNP